MIPAQRWCLVLLAMVLGGSPAFATEIAISTDGATLRGGPAELTITLSEVEGGAEVPVEVKSAGRLLKTYRLVAGEHSLELPTTGLGSGHHRLEAASDGATATAHLRIIPGWISIIPPLLAIGLALLFKDVLLSLFLGVFSGALILAWGSSWEAPFVALARTVDRYIINSLSDPSRATIIVFTLLLGGMVGVISKSGGTRGIVERIAPLATSPKRGQLATWWMGLLIFFDDYANTLIVGSTMRPIADRLKISREKLAYMVDSTAAPIASVVPISTWIGFEVGLIGAALTDIGVDLNPYSLFVESIPYRFYPIFALVLGFAIAFSGRDFGPMLAAERRARQQGRVLADGDTPLAEYGSEAVEPPAGIPHRALNALAPIVTVIVATFVGLWISGSAALAADGTTRASVGGFGAWLREVFAAADPYATLLWSSLAGLILAVALPLLQRLLSLKQLMAATVEGFKSMLLALIVLVLAWSIGGVCSDLHTADYLVGVTQGSLPPTLLPLLVFVLSAAIAFATGSSWGAMGILVPLVIPIVHGVALQAGQTVGDGSYLHLMVGAVSSVLAGSVWGDHCSPISDTTILSSIATGSDHIAHVRTQLPYALTAGIVAIVIGDLGTALGMSPWWSLLIGAALLIAGLRFFGRRSADGEPAKSHK